MSLVGEYGRNSFLERMARSHPKVMYENVTLSNGYGNLKFFGPTKFLVSMVKMLLPYGLDKHAADRRYPVLVDV